MTMYRFHKVFFLIFAIFITLIIVLYSFLIVGDAYPLTTREGAALAPLYLMNKGLNPFTLVYLPEYFYSYVFVQQIVSYPIVKIFGLNLNYLRLLNQVFIFFSSFLLFKSFLKIGATRLTAYFAALVFYAASLYLNTSEVRADAIGLFLYTSAIVTPILVKRKIIQYILVSLLSLLGLFTKFYFIAGLLIYFVFEFSKFKLKQTFVLIFVILANVLFFGMMLYLFLSEYYNYFLKPFLISSTLYKKDFLFSFKQYFVFLVLIFPLLVYLIKPNLMIDFRNLIVKWFSKSQIKDEKFNIKVYIVWGVLASTSGTILFLATNIGNQMTYLFHLMLAWYLLLYCKELDYTNKYYFGKYKVIFIAFTALIFVTYLRPWNYLKSKGEWNKVTSRIDQSSKPFASSLFSSYILQSGKPLVNSGHSEFIQYTSDNDDGLLKNTHADEVLTKNISPALLKRTREYFKEIRYNIDMKKYDLILLDNTSTIGNFYTLAINKRYHLSDSVFLYLPHSRHSVKVWIYDLN